LAIAIVKDDRVVMAKGFGLRDVEKNLPVTADTLFAIGSCSKAMTAMAAAIAQDEGKLSLDDSPKKYLPDFKLLDPEADQKITIRDMLCHRSGLAGTDIAWYTGVLSREEVIQVAGLAKPTEKFRSKFQYQNTMYSAAGEATARACGTTWEQLVADRILRPLGMNNSNFSVKQMQQSKDCARGYSYDTETKQSQLVPTRDLTNIAPAGAINSSVNDMANWVRLMVNGGELNGTRIISERGFKELTTQQIEMSPNVGYALGWGTFKLHDTPTLQHAGGIDGFNAFVVIVPEKKLGYVLLTNVSASGVHGSIQEIIWKHLVGGDAPATAPAQVAAGQPTVDPKLEVGQYGILEIAFKDGSLYAIVPGQPEYKLQNVGGRRYRLTNAPPGFFVTFRQSKEGAAEVFLEQPHGNTTFARDPSPDQTAAALAKYAGPHKDLLGTYSTEGFSMEVTVRDDKPVVIVKGQPTYSLVEKQKDVFSIPPAPDGFEVTFRRDGNGAVTGAFVKQPRPQPDMELMREASASADVDGLIQKAIAALGGEDNLRRHKTLSMSFDMTMENQGVSARGTSVATAPFAFTRTTEFIALGRPIGTTTDVFDGAQGRTEASFLQTTPYTKRQIAEARALADMLGPAGWKEQYKSIRIARDGKVGDEAATVVELKPEAGPTITVYLSKQTHLPLKREFIRTGQGSAESVSETYSDWREVDGVKIPFRIEQTSPESGKVMQTVKEAKFE
jgi:CubicO group peptidase (beta-lactamase class C family)